MNARSKWWLSFSVSTVVLVGLTWQVQTYANLRESIAREQRRAHVLEQLQGERAKLLQVRSTLAADAKIRSVELQQALEKITALRQQVKQKSPRPDMRKNLVVGEDIPAREWHNAGRKTVAAALQTALWAGSGGEISTFAEMLHFADARTAASAQALFDTVPQSWRDQYGSPEKFIAFLAVSDVPLGSVEITQSSESGGSPFWDVKLILTQADGTRKNATLLFYRGKEGWDLVVTEGVIEKYASALRAPMSGGAEKP
ncbi:MAG: hypothetical protein H7343_02030 [Undibacterium sp.]|nr:hypothetical protein [Opitutaceae bacterium]